MKEESSVVFLAEEKQSRWGRGKYLVPNAVTLGNMFCGFLTIIYAASERYEKALIAIAIAILLDGLDGRLARRLNATSKFGVEFDSFSDFISFGIAPAFLIYCWCFKIPADEFGVIVTFIYVLAASSRLARFNIAEPMTTHNFQGLPTPAAAGLVAAAVNFATKVDPSRFMVAAFSIVMVGIAYLMVSKIEFFSVKRFKFSSMNKGVLLFLGVSIALVWYNSPVGFLVLAGGYVLSGPLGLLTRRFRGKSKDLNRGQV
jgi:CDP-diacylglycerol--serine O-phosphatidyltransferase